MRNQTLLEQARATMAGGLDGLSDCVAQTKSVLNEAEEYDTKMARHLAFLCEKTATVLRELRQLEKHDKDASANLTPPETAAAALELIRTLPLELRTAVRTELDAMADHGGLG